MSKKIIFKWKCKQPYTFFEWQNKDIELFFLREGYKNGADDLVNCSLEEHAEGGTRKSDGYIYPIVTLYRYSIEISLTQIYLKLFGELPKVGNDLVELWNEIDKNITNSLNNPDFILMIKRQKKSFVLFSFDNINFNEIKQTICELKYLDQKLGAWKYLMNKSGDIYNIENESVNYETLKISIEELYENLNYIFFMVDEYWI